ncbi:Rv3235 family protein [Sphaerisporangium sp. NPDC051011]|uniref:Rv3235 family protein n=1 Tax=Sphaerisporangium sp. NPDC051011 TaxID=3155792 RepID=UPI0033CD3B8C
MSSRFADDTGVPAMSRLSSPITLPALRTVPPADPPYDEERRPGSPAAAPRPAQSSPSAARSAPPREATRPLTLTARAGLATRGGASPDERGLRGLGQAIAEVLAGRRPPGGVAERLTDRAYAELVRAGRMIDGRRPPVAAAPHVHLPCEGVVEACMLVRCGERSRVLALRVERRGVQWLCTDFETA